jgi:hypothetical protein
MKYPMGWHVTEPDDTMRCVDGIYTLHLVDDAVGQAAGMHIMFVGLRTHQIIRNRL